MQAIRGSRGVVSLDAGPGKSNAATDVPSVLRDALSSCNLYERAARATLSHFAMASNLDLELDMVASMRDCVLNLDMRRTSETTLSPTLFDITLPTASWSQSFGGQKS